MEGVRDWEGEGNERVRERREPEEGARGGGRGGREVGER